MEMLWFENVWTGSSAEQLAAFEMDLTTPPDILSEKNFLASED